MKLFGSWLCLLIALAAVGCGGPGATAAGGTVTYQGQPVVDATVLFTPDGGGEGAAMATGKTDAQGKFTLTTKSPNDGAIPGNYKVSISPAQAVQPEGDYSTPPPPPFPAKYMDPLVTDLKATVASGGDNQFALELKDG